MIPTEHKEQTETGDSAEEALGLIRKKLISVFFQRQFLLPPEVIRSINERQARELSALLADETLTQKQIDLFLQENYADVLPPRRGKVKVLRSYVKDSKKREVKDFVQYFNARYRFLSQLLRGRQELRSATAISRIQGTGEREPVVFIGCLYEKQETKNHNIILTLEDPTGKATVLVSKSRQELFGKAKSLVHDEVIGITGIQGKGIIYANSITWPDIPLNKEMKKSPVEEYAIFLSDLHIGSVDFLKEPFERFIAWLNGQVGDEEQRQRVKKIKYAFIVGDMVDGIGIYPRQESELLIPEITGQYDELTRYLRRFPPHISIIICPGNHDATRLAEPQPPIYADLTRELYALDNVIMVSNPSMIRIGEQEGFAGVDVLLYHGYSFDYYIAHVDHIRNQGGYDRADLVMKFLLRRRHLAPAHSSTLYVPVAPDPLAITEVPDIFVSGHIHKASASHYRNVTLLSGSCWQRTTSFQKKVGHHPEPARVPMVNLQSRGVKLLRFMDDE
ncbi:MAG: DNA polymerase II small subunit [DPANN group archaeon]|nr:DNA polymerase II small subunit [DPANN group archaeon]